MPSKGKKRGRSTTAAAAAAASASMFDAVELLNTQDQQAEKQRPKSFKQDVQKSLAAQSQTKIYSRLLECRILLQRSLTAAEQQQQQQQGDDDLKKSKDDAINTCNQLLVHLLEARNNLVQMDDDDDDVDYKDLVKNEDDTKLNKVLQKEFITCRDEQWKEVFNRRHKDVKLHTGQLTAKSSSFKVMDSSFWQQVEATVQYEQQQQQKKKNNNKLFDDTKVYQQLLKDFVTRNHNGNENDGAVAAAAQERLLKRQRKNNPNNSSSKPQVDRRASKGRKIRYAEIPKLVNFTFPVSKQTIPLDNANFLDQDEWFHSLFGGHNAWKK